jgi:DNA-binding winged helix-turn-helix (wHTH) protein
LYIDTQSIFQEDPFEFYNLINNEFELQLGPKFFEEIGIANGENGKPILKTRKIINAITQEDKYISIIVDTLRDLTFLDNRFLSSIKSLRDRFKGNLNFVFVSQRPIIENNHYTKFKKFADFASHVEYISTPLKKDNLDLIKKIFTKYNPNKAISTSDQETILQISGGIMGLITSMMRHIADSQDHKLKVEEFLNDTNIRQRIEFILNQFNREELNWLKSLASGNSIDADKLSIFLNESKILNVQNDDIKPTLIKKYINSKYFDELDELIEIEEKVGESDNSASPSLESDEENKNTNSDQDTQSDSSSPKKEGLYVDLKSGEIFKNGKRTQDCLSPTEIRIYKYMSTNSQKLLSRDEIAKQMWGNAYLEKYSDWAIDKAISRLRKKIEDEGKKNKHIITIKGKGIKFYP